MRTHIEAFESIFQIVKTSVIFTLIDQLLTREHITYSYYFGKEPLYTNVTRQQNVHLLQDIPGIATSKFTISSPKNLHRLFLNHSFSVESRFCLKCTIF